MFTDNYLYLTNMEFKLSEEQKKLLYQSDIRLTVLYLLPDICESLMADILDYRKKAGVKGLKFEQKMYWKAFAKDVYNLRKVMNTAPEDAQSSYGDASDLLLTLLLKVVDRCGENDLGTLMRFIEYIESFPSKRNIEFK